MTGELDTGIEKPREDLPDMIGKVPKETFTELDRIAATYSLAKLTHGSDGGFETALKMGQVMARLRTLLDDEVMSSINAIQGTRLGFLTDKREGEKYNIAVVRDCLIEGVIRGARPIGNEFNIISSKAYFTKEFFERAVKELPGLTDLFIHDTLQAKDVKDGTTVDVTYKVTWKMRGDDQIMEGSIPIRVNRGMGADAVLGKMRRKVLARVHQKITDSNALLPEGDVNDCDIPGLRETTARRVDDPLAAGRTSHRAPKVPLEPVEKEDPPSPPPARKAPDNVHIDAAGKETPAPDAPSSTDPRKTAGSGDDDALGEDVLGSAGGDDPAFDF